MQDLVFAKTQQEFEEIEQLFPSDTITEIFPIQRIFNQGHR